MKDDAGGVAVSGTNSTDSMTQVDTVITFRAFGWTVVNSKYSRVSLENGHYFNTALHPGSLFGEHEFAAGKVFSGHRQENGDLQRESEITVKILMQAVKIANAIPGHTNVAAEVLFLRI